ncbi:Pro-Pol polyprotein [Cucumispora dikerogammari]|nr:Pro-Pol polyprotein [Cucumispora dikerogammari]
MSKVPKINSEEDRRKLIVFLLTGVTPNGLNAKEKYCFKRKAEGFSFDNDILNYTIKEKKYIYVCDFERNIIEDICDHYHLPGHLGRNILRTKIYKKFVGISVERIFGYVDSCLSCKRELVPTLTLPLVPIVPNFIRERLIVDTIDLSEYADLNNGIRYVFTMIDSFSKFSWCYPSTRKTAEEFLKSLRHLHHREGTWRIFHSDNGGEFTSNEVQEYIEQKMGARIIHGAPYHPQSQGQIERFNRTLKSRIRKFLGPQNRNWVSILDNVVYQYNTVKHKATDLSPFVLFKGFDPINPNWNNPDDFFKIQQVRNHFAKYVESYRREYNERINTTALNIGDRVLLARDFNPKFKRRSHALESYYHEETFIIALLNNGYALIYNEGDITEEKRVHKTLLLKID